MAQDSVVWTAAHDGLVVLLLVFEEQVHSQLNSNAGSALFGFRIFIFFVIANLQLLASIDDAVVQSLLVVRKSLNVTMLTVAAAVFVCSLQCVISV